jgi:hypothetical protein
MITVLLNWHLCISPAHTNVIVLFACVLHACVCVHCRRPRMDQFCHHSHRVVTKKREMLKLKVNAKACALPSFEHLFTVHLSIL